MDREQVGRLAAVVLVVLALGLTATAVDDVDFDGADEGTSDGGTNESGNASATDGDEGDEGDSLADSAVPDWVGIVVVFLVAAGLAFVARNASLPPITLAVLVTGVAILAILAGAAVLDLSGDGSGSDETEPANFTPDAPPTPTPTPAAGEGGTGDESSGLGPLTVLGGALLTGLLLIAWFASDRAGPVLNAAADGDAEGQTAAVGRAAGRAAERVETADLSNAVFQAWREMTDALELADPETTTPAAFAEAAIAAGMDREDVTALTELFRAVRYGEAEITPERERQAREILEAIRDAYAPEAERNE